MTKKLNPVCNGDMLLALQEAIDQAFGHMASLDDMSDNDALVVGWRARAEAFSDVKSFLLGKRKSLLYITTLHDEQEKIK
jgi:hypothetical protein